MKEVYIKPQLHVESFVLSQSVAQSCGWTDAGFIGRPTHGNPSSCGWELADDGVAGDIIWTSSHNCDMIASEDVEVSEGCYNAPSGMNQIFAS